MLIHAKTIIIPDFYKLLFDGETRIQHHVSQAWGSRFLHERGEARILPPYRTDMRFQI